MSHRQTWPQCNGVTIRGRLFHQTDIVLIRKLIRQHPTWNRTRISKRVAVQLEWTQANGMPKERACRVALARLQRLGFIDLPPPRSRNCGGKPPIVHTVDNRALTARPVQEMPDEIELRRVSSVVDARLWNAVIAQYHYVGLVTPVGKLIRYLCFSGDALLGAISFTGATWSTEARSMAMRAVGLDPSPAPDFVVSNNRFLLLPNVRVKNLASRVLSKSIVSIRSDWRSRYGQEPLFAETFVDPSRFSGTSYLAANWINIGMTKGYSKRGQAHYKNYQQKLIFLRGICPRYHELLRTAYGVSA